jgi:uncharacterized protein
MKITFFSREYALNLILHRQGLLNTDFGEGKDGVYNVIKRLGYVQIDTLAVVARAHHHVLWSRLPGYRENYLDQLVEEKKVFEYWSHAASYLPMENFRFSIPRKKAYEDGIKHWFPVDEKMKKYVFDRIRAEGPLRSKDFEHNSRNESWFDWKPAKRALEQLFMEGKLMVSRRQGFQKVYDLAERVLPEWVNTTFPTNEEVAENLIMESINSQGLVTIEEIGYLRISIKPHLMNLIKKLQESHKIVPVKIEDIDAVYYTFPEFTEFDEKPDVSELHILSPFDNLVIQRKRLQMLFDFDYVIECYVPEKKRKYGYFSLPLMYGNRFIGRMDSKADRKMGNFIVRSLDWEVQPVKNVIKEAFEEKLNKFAEFNGCRNIVF